ncbi:MAG: hypothetical protein ABIO44_12045, partial [Saprospiraceae bacterium]
MRNIFFILAWIGMNSLQSQDQLIGEYQIFIDGTPTGSVCSIKKLSSVYSLNINDQSIRLKVSNNNLVAEDVNNEIFIQSNEKNAVLLWTGYKMNLVRVNNTNETKRNEMPNTINSSDPFVGNFELNSDIKSGGKLNISTLDHSTYKLTSSSGYDLAILQNKKLMGKTKGIDFEVYTQGSELIMVISGTHLRLKRLKSEELITDSKTIDQRLLGAWIGTTSYNSSGGVGNASLATQYVYKFNSDGTYEYQLSDAGGGSSWSSSGSGPIQKGKYHVTELNESAGSVIINGHQMRYVFIEEG